MIQMGRKHSWPKISQIKLLPSYLLKKCEGFLSVIVQPSAEQKVVWQVHCETR